MNNRNFGHFEHPRVAFREFGDYSKRHEFYKLQMKESRPVTYILGARCKNGVVLIGDRKAVTLSGEQRDFTSKIKCLQFPEYAQIVFAGAGASFVFDEFLKEMPRRVAKSMALFKEENKKHPQFHLDYSHYDFRTDCMRLLQEMKKRYSGLSKKYGSLLVMCIVQKEAISKKFYNQNWTLYCADLIDCKLVPQDRKVELSYYPHHADIFLTSWSRKESTIRDTARLGSFIIKYIEKEKLADKTIGVGKQQPQIWFFEDNKDEPREIIGSELKKLLKGVDDEVEKKRREIGSLSKFLRL